MQYDRDASGEDEEDGGSGGLRSSEPHETAGPSSDEDSDHGGSNSSRSGIGSGRGSDRDRNGGGRKAPASKRRRLAAAATRNTNREQQSPLIDDEAVADGSDGAPSEGDEDEVDNHGNIPGLINDEDSSESSSRSEDEGRGEYEDPVARRRPRDSSDGGGDEGDGGAGRGDDGSDSNKWHASRRGGKGDRSALKGKTRSGGNGGGQGGGTAENTSQQPSVDAATATSAISAAKNGDRIELKYTKGGRHAVWKPGTITSRKRGSSFNVTMDDGEKRVCDLGAGCATWRFEPTESAAPSVDALLGEPLSGSALLKVPKGDYIEELLDKLRGRERGALPPLYRQAWDLWDPTVRGRFRLKNTCRAVFDAWGTAWTQAKQKKRNEQRKSTEHGRASTSRAQATWLATPGGADSQRAAETTL